MPGEDIVPVRDVGEGGERVATDLAELVGPFDVGGVAATGDEMQLGLRDVMLEFVGDGGRGDDVLPAPDQQDRAADAVEIITQVFMFGRLGHAHDLTGPSDIGHGAINFVHQLRRGMLILEEHFADLEPHPFPARAARHHGFKAPFEQP